MFNAQETALLGALTLRWVAERKDAWEIVNGVDGMLEEIDVKVAEGIVDKLEAGLPSYLVNGPTMGELLTGDFNNG
jgi:hypothetical protein